MEITILWLKCSKCFNSKSTPCKKTIAVPGAKHEDIYYSNQLCRYASTDSNDEYTEWEIMYISNDIIDDV